MRVLPDGIDERARMQRNGYYLRWETAWIIPLLEDKMDESYVGRRDR